MNNWLNSIQDCLFPPTCLFCDGPGYNTRDLCAACYDVLLRNENHCPRCAAPLETDTPAGCLCGHCLKQLPSYDSAHAPFLYHDAMRYLIHGLKFRHRLHNARLLGTLLADTLETSRPLPQLLIPVPLHPSRYRERGFNQAIEIARTTAKRLRIPLDFSICRRRRDTPHQTGLTAQQRHKNLHNAFQVNKALPGQHVAIIDDVMTSGTTVNELAKALKKAGAVRVDAWTCARA